MRPARAFVMLAAATVLTRQAHASERRFAWRGPDCAETAPLLEQRLTDLVASRERERLAGSVFVMRNTGGYSVQVTIALDGKALGTRRFDAASCERAAEMAAVAISLAVFEGQSESKDATKEPAGPDPGARRPEPVPETARPQPERTATAPPAIEPRLGALGLLQVGALPEPAWGAALELELALARRWSVALLAGATLEQSRRLLAEQRVHLRLFSGAARACVAPLSGPYYRIDACAGAWLMWARGEGDGFDVNHTASLLWAAPLLGANVSMRAPSFVEWRGELDGSIPLARRRFLVDGSEVARAAVVSLGLRLGALVRF